MKRHINNINKKKSKNLDKKYLSCDNFDKFSTKVKNNQINNC